MFPTADPSSPHRWWLRTFERLCLTTADDRAGLLTLPLHLEHVPRGEMLIREGDVPDRCRLLVQGYACRSKEGPNGSRQIVSFHLPGDILDLQHMLLKRADHDVETITDAQVAWTPCSGLIKLAWERPAIGQALWRDSLIEASIFREWVLNVGRRTGKARVAHMLCEFVARCQAAGLGSADSFTLPMTQDQIGDATGLTSIHVNRMLRNLENDGAIVRSLRHYRISDWQRLQAIADFDPAYLHTAA